MINLQKIRLLNNPKTIVFGNHTGIIQSVLDYDFLIGRENPSILAIVGVQQKSIRYFFGNKEVVIPGYTNLNEIDPEHAKIIDLFILAQSGRRAVSVSIEAINTLPNILGGMIFAENFPEKFAIDLRTRVESSGKFIIGPASVGMVVGGLYKLGAIAGTSPNQIVESGTLTPGSTAIVSTSGGMINELIAMVSESGSSISIAIAVGGERFPLVNPAEIIDEAIKDKNTKSIVFFGELGGMDEYEIAKLLKKVSNKKPIIAYVAGIAAEKLESPPQFGHAKALAQNKSETTTEKKNALRASGITVADSFSQFESMLLNLEKDKQPNPVVINERLDLLNKRSKALFHSNISTDRGGEVRILGEPIVDFVEGRTLSNLALAMFLGKEPKKQITKDFFEISLKLLVDHGPQVSGAVNTIITARAGRDLPSALASGLLTIGPRFGGAINQAASNWFNAVISEEKPYNFVERFAKDGKYIPGIGHKKYNVGNPDKRVRLLLDKFGIKGRYTDFAYEVAKITSSKKSNLILNVDGVVAALLLDIMEMDEGYSKRDLETLINSEFFNAIFIYSRTVGFIAHFIEQKRFDDGLFRLPDNLI